MKPSATLIIVYSDSSQEGGGFRGPIFQDNTFENIPIPSKKKIGIKYSEIIGTHGNPLSDYIPTNRLTNSSYAHFDPDPVHLTYGDTGNSRVANRCRKLLKGDILVWGTRLRKYITEWYVPETERIYLTGWLIVERVINGDHLIKNNKEYLINNLNKNAHILNCTLSSAGNLEYERQKFFYRFKRQKEVIVFGKENMGGQLEKAIPLTSVLQEGEYMILPEMKKYFQTASKLLRIGPYNLNFHTIYDYLSEKNIKNPKIPVRWS